MRMRLLHRFLFLWLLDAEDRCRRCLANPLILFPSHITGTTKSLVLQNTLQLAKAHFQVHLGASPVSCEGVCSTACVQAAVDRLVSDVTRYLADLIGMNLGRHFCDHHWTFQHPNVLFICIRWRQSNVNSSGMCWLTTATPPVWLSCVDCHTSHNVAIKGI